MLNQVARKTVMMASAVAMLAGCGKGTGSYSLLNDGSDYKQQAVLIPKKIDVLWVIDNSGSMATSQNNLAANFQSFIQRFNSQNYDFHMAVTGTDAWDKQFNAGSTKAKIRDGAGANHSGVFVIDKNTPNINTVFATNAKQGTNGTGDERALESIKQTLLEPTNAAFRRPDAFLAVIVVSDEEDFSHTTNQLMDGTEIPVVYANPYSNPNLFTVQSYVDFLDIYTEKSVYGKNYSVNAITVPDIACSNQLSTDGFSRKLATRVQEITNITGGVNGSLCSNFGSTLSLISDTIIQLSSSFKLSRDPQVDTISVTVDNVTVVQDATNGWTYDEATMILTFHGSSVPAANANIQIDFYPKSINL